MKATQNFALIALSAATLLAPQAWADQTVVRVGKGKYSISVSTDRGDASAVAATTITADPNQDRNENSAAGENQDSNKVPRDGGKEPRSESGTKDLSVPPMDHVQYPETRPDWVESGVSSTSDDRKVKIVVVGPPGETKSMADAQAEVLALAALEAYARDSVEFVPFSFDIYDLGDFKRFVQREYRGTVEVGGITHFETAYEMELSSRDRRRLLRVIKNAELGGRLSFLTVSGLGGAAMLLASGGVLSLASRRAEKRQSKSATV
ncbi:MAG: hypothetical protein AAF958_10930 [Planctomycetota bacterium]